MTDTDPNLIDAGPAPSTEPSAENGGGVTMYTTSWCGFCARLKRGLQSEGIAFDEVNIEEVDGAADLVMARNGGNRTVPTLVFADGSGLTNPSVADVKEQLARLA